VTRQAWLVPVFFLEVGLWERLPYEGRRSSPFPKVWEFEYPQASLTQPQLVTLRLSTRLLTTSVQILTAQPQEVFEVPGSWGGLTTHQTIFEATTSTVAAALGFKRQQRGTYFIQQSLFKHLRRAIILLGLPVLSV